MHIAGLVVAGGKATRMGMDKPFVRFRGGCLLDAVIERAQPQVDVLMLNVRPELRALCLTHYGTKFPLLADAFEGNAGPLGGVIAGLQHLSCTGARWLATFPCDTSFLPRNIVATIAAARKPPESPVVAVASGQVQSLCALWPYACLDALHDGVVSGGFRSVWWALDALNAERVEVSAEPHAFFNVNTPEDLIEAENLARGNYG